MWAFFCLIWTLCLKRGRVQFYDFLILQYKPIQSMGVHDVHPFYKHYIIYIIYIYIYSKYREKHWTSWTHKNNVGKYCIIRLFVTWAFCGRVH